ncbi:ubiquinol-cytochrome c reductase cytochrome c1 subunit [Alcanivorax xiamenensis]|uniref:Ubiquinol-cytochrome c reductase cytochrome c1 subunit n=1 Tax=Alcanivorax xiamenensis TaxID=1177156 RepID=A0ABQ6YCN3_9GAMM|nr:MULTISPECIES: cytochrome c1 [Alcanivorax]KAF0807993.1 ubiquinol-cytochrome c reductase cytochrome c1 subunit [Alcanivorax xiamenensis]
MKKLFAAILFSCLPALALAAGGHDAEYEKAPVNLQDKVSLQNGAKLFVNYCMGCHSLEYLRYGRMADDLGIPDELVLKYMNFTSDKIGDQMRNAMDKDDAKQWFGTAPPDLTLEARLRDPDWLYSYLIGFYEDESRPFGYNNKVFPNVGMPHVMAGMQEALDEEEFKAAMGDITNFLTYAAEPIAPTRERIGVYVLVFLAILLVPAYLLKKEYWKDVH